MRGFAFQPLVFSALAALLICAQPGYSPAQGNGYREFANKDGQKIEAKVVSVTPDWKTMKIERRDGQSFDIVVNGLSLDDQQYLKEWIAENPNSAKIDYRLDVAISKNAENAKRERDTFDYYRFKTEDVNYEVEVKNLTREALVGAVAEYVVILEDRASIYRENGRAYSYNSDSSGDYKFVRGTVKLPDLKYAYTHEFKTDSLPYHSISEDGNVQVAEDKMVGAIIRIAGPNGDEVGIFRSSEAGIKDVEWDEVKGNLTGSGGAALKVSSVSKDTPELPESMPVLPVPTPGELPDWLTVRELDSLPGILQKGDMIRNRNMPKLGGKAVRISALVDIDEDDSGGVIVACGGAAKGFSLFVLDDALHFWSRRAFENNRTRWMGIKVDLAEVPKDEFRVDAEFGAELLKLWIDGDLKQQGASTGLLNFNPQEGLSVGFDSEDSAVGRAAAPHPFRGIIRDVKVELGS